MNMVHRLLSGGVAQLLGVQERHYFGKVARFIVQV